MFEFKLPELAENVEAATVTQIMVNVGDTIAEGQNVIELETEKAAMEVPSPAGGVVKEIPIKQGQDVKVGQTILKIDTDAKAKAAPSKGKQPPKEEKPAAAPAKAQAGPEPVATEAPAAPTPAPAPAPQPAAPATATVAEQITTAHTDVPAAPSVRRFAREIGINIPEVPGSGPGGRISLEDVKVYAKQLNTGAISRPMSAGAQAHRPLPDFTKFGQVERKPMNNIRRKTAEHLSHSWTSAPHVTQFDKTDITELEKLRKKYSKKGTKLTVTPFILKVMASALKTFPQFNASVDTSTNEMIYKKYCNIGVAVDTDRGLLVPVIKDVDKKSILEIATEITEIAERARNKKTTLEEMQGGCLTLTNLGGIGGTHFTPIINWPEVAILGTSRAQWEPVYENNQFVPRFMLPLSLSYDHRMIDGADGARFLRWIAEAIEQPFLIELEG